MASQEFSLVDAERIRAVAAAAGMALAPAAVEQVARFGALFLTWNARINLGGAISSVELVARHFLDSFAASGFVPDGCRVADVGSGGGLPAIPLAIVRPDLRLELFEPTGKKVAFLRTAARELSLGERLRIHPRRVDLSGPVAAGGATGGFDVAMSRATLAPSDWLPLGRTLVRPGGRVIVFATSRVVPEEGGAEAPEAQAGYAPGRWLHVYGSGR